MTTIISSAARNASADGVAGLADGGAAAAHLKIYTGSQPAGPDTAASGTLLVDITLADPAFGAASGGVATMSGAPKSATASGTGTAGWYRVEDSNGAGVVDGSVTATGGGGDIELDNTSIASGQTVSISSLTITAPAS